MSNFGFKTCDTYQYVWKLNYIKYYYLVFVTKSDKVRGENPHETVALELNKP